MHAPVREPSHACATGVRMFTLQTIAQRADDGAGACGTAADGSSGFTTHERVEQVGRTHLPALEHDFQTVHVRRIRPDSA